MATNSEAPVCSQLVKYEADDCNWPAPIDPVPFQAYLKSHSAAFSSLPFQKKYSDFCKKVSFTPHIITKNETEPRTMSGNPSSPKQKRRKVMKPQRKVLSDYRKNICGYVTKKIIKEFIGPIFRQQVMILCQKHRCNYSQATSYYLNKSELVTGPSHLPMLLVPEDASMLGIKRAFREFSQWFLKQRYLRCILNEGKMVDKLEYIRYKNRQLLGHIHRKSVNTKVKVQEQDQHQNRQQEIPFQNLLTVKVEEIKQQYIQPQQPQI